MSLLTNEQQAELHNNLKVKSYQLVNPPLRPMLGYLALSNEEKQRFVKHVESEWNRGVDISIDEIAHKESFSNHTIRGWLKKYASKSMRTPKGRVVRKSNYKESERAYMKNAAIDFIKADMIGAAHAILKELV